MSNAGRKFPVETLDRGEVASLVAVINGNGVVAVRNRALIAVLAGSGLRISEALALRPSDLLANGSINVRDGKGRKQRIAHLAPDARVLLSAWLDRRLQLVNGVGDKLNGRQPVFCGVSAGDKANTVGLPIATSYVRRLLPQLADKAGIDKRVHARGLRHTHATDLVERRASLRVIQAQLGHASSATTDNYIAKIAPKARLEAMDALYS